MAQLPPGPTAATAAACVQVLGPWLAYCVLRAVYDAAWDASEDVLETAAGPEDSSAAAAAGPEEAAP